MIEFLTFTNENLTAATVIVAASMLLYNLVRNIHDRVTRASSVLLGCVTIVSAAESIAGLEPSYTSLENWYRLQWLGIAFMPAAMFHLANALLSTTGRVSRGKRRLTVRLFYGFSLAFALVAIFTDTLVGDLATHPVNYLSPGWMFPVYVLYFGVAATLAMSLVARARNRCLTSATRRRMSFLLVAFLAPGLGIFPYSPLFASLGNETNIPLLPLLVAFNAANLFMIITLIFLAYPLSFFGADKPDRVVKADLLQFMLSGPFVTIIILATLVTVPRLSNILGLKSEDFVIVAVVTLLLSLQWGISLVLPRLEQRLIYNLDQQEAHRLKSISERLLTRADTDQLQETLLAAVCDHLRVHAALMASFQTTGIKLEKVVSEPDLPVSLAGFDQIEKDLTLHWSQHSTPYSWGRFWLYPLYSPHTPTPAPAGVLGIWERDDLSEEEQELLYQLIDRASQVLADLHLQAQVLDALDTFAAGLDRMRQLQGISSYGHIQQETLENSDAFVYWVRCALRDFWGGPKLTQSELMELHVVKREQSRHSGNRIQALQTVLTEAIERLKPMGERTMTSPEWMIYNILDLRFLQKKKVRDVTNALYMSEPDFYRKQKIAIEEVARQVSEMERTELTAPANNHPLERALTSGFSE